jgi:hypothetical protein
VGVGHESRVSSACAHSYGLLRANTNTFIRPSGWTLRKMRLLDRIEGLDPLYDNIKLTPSSNRVGPPFT